MSEYLRAFIIGSSWPVFILYFYGVSKNTKKNYSYKNYTFIAPIALGLFNVAGYVISQKLNLSRGKRFILTGLISAICVAIFITIFKAYNFSTTNDWIGQYITLLITYTFVFGVIANAIDTQMA